jgi:hypothetical protein
MAKKLIKLFDFTQRKMLQFGWFKVMIYEQSPTRSPVRSPQRVPQEVPSREIYGSQ